MRTGLTGSCLLALALAACDASNDDHSAPVAGAAGAAGGSTAGAAGQGTGGTSAPGAGGTSAAGQASGDDHVTVVADSNAFAVSLYDRLRALPESSGKNLWFSPISLTLALGMTSAGAVGQTQDEIRQAMHVTLPDARLHPALGWLRGELGKRPQQARDAAKASGQPERPVVLNLINSVWAEQSYPWKSTYQDVLTQSYGASMTLGDFVHAPEAQRTTINAWVADQTDQQITSLLPPGALDEQTRFALVNAVALTFPWLVSFDEKKTGLAPFTVEGGTTKDVTTMRGGAIGAGLVMGRYAEDALAEAIALPLAGQQLSLVVYVPKAGQFAAFEASLASELASLKPVNGDSPFLDLSLPRVSLPGSPRELTGVLEQMGMELPFSGECGADFSAMLPMATDCLYIQKVFHQATLDIDEQGLKATAATAVVGGGLSSSPTGKEVHVDRSFVLGIRDDETGAMLFLGRILDPSQH